MTSENIWRYAPEAGHEPGRDLVGFSVEAKDGSIGTIDENSDEVGSSFIVVDTGPWIFGKQVLLPAGTITRVDVETRTVHLDRTKDEVKDAPEFDAAKFGGEPSYLEKFGLYYGRLPHL
ncbi:PRC-barrel domain-containing protein [Streptomyces sp. NPDC046237]|uniref:PRC-barrel domain-containing protein n=1 Tax=Streptomyces sp. NPDC046237 TaxID=3154914 RepID=UPI0033C0C22A